MHIDNITDKINGELQNYVRNGLKLYICKDANYNVYMFTVVLDEKMLNDNWENIQNKIALDFQSNIQKEIELWNIYIIFFIENKMEQKDLKYKIENDHYCARKILIDNIGDIKNDEEKIKLQIHKKLFDLKIPEPTVVKSIDALESDINIIDPRLTNLNQINNLIKQYKD
ncbi:ABC-three component system middle component 1 [Aliarcobacter butzleri]|uniref:ABC-three component system middle component 1 n=1 Tax=Aliarcobacter butzleri TaxID=28197 RepID=UPI001EDB561B|nr:ABC-three component system middle component 1 [Aliarcobacter butzleri]MCG3693326.1 hypothetical protein [Aliarcobacter butzleri]